MGEARRGGLTSTGPRETSFIFCFLLATHVPAVLPGRGLALLPGMFLTAEALLDLLWGHDAKFKHAATTPPGLPHHALVSRRLVG